MPAHEKIKMDQKRFSYFPQRFTWRGRRYDVHAIERCWTVSRNKVERLCFRVRCAATNGQEGRTGRAILEGTFDLYQDLNTNSWYVEKVRAFTQAERQRLRQ